MPHRPKQPASEGVTPGGFQEVAARAARLGGETLSESLLSRIRPRRNARGRDIQIHILRVPGSARLSSTSGRLGPDDLGDRASEAGERPRDCKMVEKVGESMSKDRIPVRRTCDKVLPRDHKESD
jgi:hypothetical protein